MNKKTIFLFNVYNQEGFLGSNIVKAFRQVVKWVPFGIWRWFSFLIAFGIYILDKVAPWLIKSKYSDVHYSNNLKELWQQIYDAFGAHYYQFPMSRKEQVELFKKANLRVKIEEELGYVLVKNS